MDDYESIIENRRVISREGVITTITSQTFSIICKPTAEIWEQQVVQLLKEWVRSRVKNDE